MEPFRPLVDCAVRNIVLSRGIDVDGEAKQSLASLIELDVPLGDGVSPVSVALIKLATSLGQSFETGKLELALLTPPSFDVLKGLGE